MKTKNDNGQCVQSSDLLALAQHCRKMEQASRRAARGCLTDIIKRRALADARKWKRWVEVVEKANAKSDSIDGRVSIPFDSSLCVPGPSGGGWSARLETWWGKRIVGFPGGLPNAIWHTPDAAARRMLWLERKTRKENQ